MEAGQGHQPAGEVRFQGEDIARMSAAGLRHLRRQIQIVFQDPYTSLDPRMTVGDIIAEPMEIHWEAGTRNDRRRRVGELLEMVGLDPSHISRYPHQIRLDQRMVGKYYGTVVPLTGACSALGNAAAGWALSVAGVAAVGLGTAVILGGSALALAQPLLRKSRRPIAAEQEQPA